MKINAQLLIAVLVLSTISASASAANFRFLKDSSPVMAFNQDDWRIFKAAFRNTLENKPDGTTATWKNPDTGASGSLTPVSTFESKGMTCRKLEIHNTAGGNSAKKVFAFCKYPDDTWKSANTKK